MIIAGSHRDRTRDMPPIIYPPNNPIYPPHNNPIYPQNNNPIYPGYNPNIYPQNNPNYPSYNPNIHPPNNFPLNPSYPNYNPNHFDHKHRHKDNNDCIITIVGHSSHKRCFNHNHGYNYNSHGRPIVYDTNGNG